MAKVGVQFDPFVPSKGNGSSYGAIEALPEKASLASKAGALVLIDANGFADQCGANPAKVYAVALEDAKNDATAGRSYLLCARVEPGRKFQGTLTGAALAALPLAANHRGLECDVVLDAGTGRWVLNGASAVNKRVKITGWEAGPGGWDIGDTFPVVEFEFLATVLY